MQPNPDDLPRTFEGYDPDEPLIVRYGDVIAARNAVVHLIQMLQDPEDPPSPYREYVIRYSLAKAVEKTGTAEFATVEDAADWLIDLRTRLTGCLPSSTTQSPRPPT